MVWLVWSPGRRCLGGVQHGVLGLPGMKYSPYMTLAAPAAVRGEVHDLVCAWTFGETRQSAWHPHNKTRVRNETQVLAVTELRVKGRHERPTITVKMSDWRGDCATGQEPREKERGDIKATTGRQRPEGRRRGGRPG